MTGVSWRVLATIGAIVAIGAVAACGPDTVYLYDLYIENRSAEGVTVVPTSGGGAGTHSTAYSVPPVGQRWATHGVTWPQTHDAEVLVFDTNCRLSARLTIPRRDAGDVSSPSYLLTIDTAATLQRVQADPAELAPESNLAEICPATSPPMWTAGISLTHDIPVH